MKIKTVVLVKALTHRGKKQPRELRIKFTHIEEPHV